MKAIIIEDIPAHRKELINLLKAYKDVEVVSECGDVFSALKAIKEYKPDVIFLDIALPGHEDGFILLDYMDPDDRPHVVFVTGGPKDNAIRAINTILKKGFYYLEKPVEIEQLKMTIGQIREQLIQEQLIVPDKNALPYPEKKFNVIPCIFNKRIKFIKPEEVEFVRSDTSGVHIVCQDNEYYTELTLKTLLQKTDLVQSHRQYLIALWAVDEIEKLDHGLAEIRTHSKKTVPVSRLFRNKLGQALGLQKD